MRLESLQIARAFGPPSGCVYFGSGTMPRPCVGRARVFRQPYRRYLQAMHAGFAHTSHPVLVPLPLNTYRSQYSSAQSATTMWIYIISYLICLLEKLNCGSWKCCLESTSLSQFSVGRSCYDTPNGGEPSGRRCHRMPCPHKKCHIRCCK